MNKEIWPAFSTFNTYYIGWGLKYLSVTLSEALFLRYFGLIFYIFRSFLWRKSSLYLVDVNIYELNLNIWQNIHHESGYQCQSLILKRVSGCVLHFCIYLTRLCVFFLFLSRMSLPLSWFASWGNTAQSGLISTLMHILLHHWKRAHMLILGWGLQGLLGAKLSCLLATQ